MAHGIFWIAALSLLWGGTLARHEDCEVPPKVNFATVRIEDENDRVRAIYACHSGYTLEGETELICDLDTDEWNTDPPTCVKIQSEDDDDNVEQSAANQKKKKFHNIQEDPLVSADYAENLDMSCVSAKVKAPEIRNGFVQKYDRRRKGEHVFIVAFYSCNDNFELENSERNAIYCSKKEWVGQLPNCIALAEYDEEEDYDESYDDGGEEEDVEEETKRTVVQPPPPPPQTTTSTEPEYTVKVSAEDEGDESTPESKTDINIVVAPTRDPYTPRVLDQSCGPDKAGCEHKCDVVLYPGEHEPRMVCSCFSGFTLDPYDFKRCHDNDECDINNGGCEQVCKNTPGSYECACNVGLQIETATGNTCVDIDECESPEIAQRCPGGCENTHGSYICHPQPDEEQSKSETETETQPESRPEHAVQCEEGYHRDSDGNCVDIDECTAGIARCENCRNTQGSYDCICPTGYELAEDEISCMDINECEAYATEEQEGSSKLCSHECHNTPGSFVCRCGENFHLEDDQRTCVPDTCEYRNNPESNKPRCSYYCEDTADGPVCKCPATFELDTDKATCVPSYSDACQVRGGNERCAPGTCVNLEEETYRCNCPAGYRDKGYYCEDIDECSESDVCGDKGCRNTDGGYSCICEDGSLLDESGRCPNDYLCADNNGGCSHECSSTNGRVECQCPAKMKLSPDGLTCVHEDPCANGNNGCSQICNSQLEGTCSCERGYELQADGKTCRDYDECIDNNGGCEHICVNSDGGYECLCRQGYMLEDGSCQDVDECALDTHNCATGLECQNLVGSYACQCPYGFAFAPNSTTECFDVDECSLSNGNCSHNCINLRGSFQCSCPMGHELLSDGRTCELVDGCQLDNGGCSHTCVSSETLTSCACPYGYALGADRKTCEDVDECRAGLAQCSHSCVNSVGSFSCACAAGYALTDNGRDCFDEDECVVNNGNCSNICINLLGSFSCACESGFELAEDLRTCVDTDECEQSIHECSHYCVNVVGTYECSCPAGFVLGPNRKTCSDVDECSDSSTCSHICTNTLGSFMCECPPGMVLDGDKKTCVDGDFCNRLQPQCSHYCENTASGFQCGCPLGYTLGSDGLTCVDVNECVVNNGGCSYSCTNVEGSFRCLCPEDAKLAEDGRSCVKFNECDINNGGCAHYCLSTPGGRSCECSDGFMLQPDGVSCAESDPCRRDNGGCDQLCAPSGLGVRCDCRPGYTLSPVNNSTCDDVDECLMENVCPQQTCRNTPGGYECVCPAGYTRNLVGQCVDINECEYQNGGCKGECVNLPGDFECKCPRGQRLGRDRKSCIEIKDQCEPFRPPKYGEIHCTRLRHKAEFYYKTKCSVWCVPGYKLEGPTVRHCNADGQWDDFENHCVPEACPRLPTPKYGTILPNNCLVGTAFVGERCMLHCHPGYKPIGKATTVCSANQVWSTNSTFDCMPIGARRVYNASPLGQVGTRRTGPAFVDGVRPFIKCPRNTTVLLPAGHTTAHIILQKPKTNMDYRYVESFPEWSRNLQAHLGAGVHVITFRGRDPNTRRGAACRTVITVKQTDPPKVTFCPTSFEVILARNQERRSVTWQEPQFQGLNKIKTIHKSNIPGQLFAEGVHRVAYEAVDSDGLTARCEFNIVVKAAPLQSLSYYNYPQIQDRSAKLLANHDSYIICAGQAPVKLYGNKPINLPPNCYVKNIRVSPIRQYTRRRLVTHRWTPFSSF